ncbi:hypothetical protein C2S51_022465 [Perilla frutescens var. frutescens]|nr:hypothetical protein C2S51_022465 [Perilla frutescens var. frutescens]
MSDFMFSPTVPSEVDVQTPMLPNSDAHVIENENEHVSDNNDVNDSVSNHESSDEPANNMTLRRFSLLSSSLTLRTLPPISFFEETRLISLCLDRIPVCGLLSGQFNEDLKGWTAAGNATLQIANSPSGNNYAVASNITQQFSDGISQTINVDNEMHYTISAWIQVGQGEAKIEADLKTSTGIISAGGIVAKSGCWTMLKGGFVPNVTEPAELHFVFNVTGSIDLWFDSVSVKPFTQEEWTSQNDCSFKKYRMRNVSLSAVDENGAGLANASISLKQVKPNFPLGCVINKLILNNPPYQKWFLDRFQYTVFENEMKWSYNEDPQGVENYTFPDAMLEFAKSNGLTVRGHNILWDDPKYMLPWVKALPPDQQRQAAVNRINSVVTRYKGQLLHWDVVNENMHWAQFSSLFPGKSTDIFKLTHELDPSPILFLNEYNVIEDNNIVGKAVPPAYLAKIDEIRAGGYDGPLGIGLECHFDYHNPNIPSIRASLDMFAATGLPIWITEFTVSSQLKDQMKFLTPLLRELHSHPAVAGILFWSSVYPDGKCYSMCLTDQYYKNVPAGDAVDEFINEFIKPPGFINVTTDSNGSFVAPLVYGEYEANVTLPNGAKSSAPQTFNIVPDGETSVQLKVNV